MKGRILLLILGCCIFFGGCSFSYSSDTLDEKPLHLVHEQILKDDISDISIDLIRGNIKFLKNIDDDIGIVEYTADNFVKFIECAIKSKRNPSI